MYSKYERWLLWFLCIFGLTIINGVFLYSVFIQPQIYIEAIQNPIAAVFMVETFIILGLLSYYLLKWEKLRIKWWIFVGLSILGSMLFALPIALLWGTDAEKK